MLFIVGIVLSGPRHVRRQNYQNIYPTIYCANPVKRIPCPSSSQDGPTQESRQQSKDQRAQVKLYLFCLTGGQAHAKLI